MTDYLRTGAVRKPWVGIEGDHLRVDYGFYFTCCHVTKMHWDHKIRITMALQNRKVVVASECLQGRHMQM